MLEGAVIGDEGEWDDGLEESVWYFTGDGEAGFGVEFIFTSQYDFTILCYWDMIFTCPCCECFILCGAEEVEVVESIFDGFDVAIEHGCVCVESELVGDFVYFEPFGTANFPFECFIVDAVIEDFCASAGE